MSKKRTIPAIDTTDLPTTTILVDGKALRGEFQIISIATTKGVNQVGMARIVLVDGDPAKEDFAISSSGDLIPGKKVELKAGYQFKEETIFKGIILRNGLEVQRNGGSMFVVDCKDEAVKMTVGRKNAYFYEMKDSEIIEELIGKYGGLKADVTATSANNSEMVQFYCTDWDFMVARAERNGLLIYNDDGTISAKKPDMKANPVLTLGYGSTIFDFSAEMDARLQYKGVSGTAWDFAEQDTFELEAEKPGITEPGNISGDELSKIVGLDEFALLHGGYVTDQEMQAWADATLLRSRLAKIRGTVTFQGVSEIKPGDVLELFGLGDRFNGKVFVAGVRQDVSSGNWETIVEFGLSEKWFIRNYKDVMGLPASGQLPGIHGLQIATVVALEGDPNGDDRIQVRMPLISKTDDGVWARLATLDAGENRGFVFRPEIDDEVVVGFLHGDPREAVVLGHLHSSAKPSPIPGSDDNHEKGLTTRSEMKVTFDDDKVKLSIETPKGNRIVLDEDTGSILVEDENGNKIEMTSSGIDMESPGDINIKASGDLTLEGLNVNVSASVELKAEGGAGAELSTGATCVVKGALVQIN